MEGDPEKSFRQQSNIPNSNGYIQILLHSAAQCGYPVPDLNNPRTNHILRDMGTVREKRDVAVSQELCSVIKEGELSMLLKMGIK